MVSSYRPMSQTILNKTNGADARPATKLVLRYTIKHFDNLPIARVVGLLDKKEKKNLKPALIQDLCY